VGTLRAALGGTATAFGDLVGADGSGAHVGVRQLACRLEAQPVDLVSQVAGREVAVHLGRDARVTVVIRSASERP